MAMKLTAGDLQVITQAAVFRGLGAETVEHIIAPATAIRLLAHACLTRQQDLATAFFIVIDGWVKIYRNAPSGEETVINMLKKGDSYAESVALTGNYYLASANAVTDARIARIPADHVVRCIRHDAQIGLAMIASTSERLAGLVQQAEQLKAYTGLQRVAEFITSLCAVEQGACVIALPYDKVIIASLLGLTPEYLSRAFARLRSDGVLVNASRVTVHDVARLRQVAGEDRVAVRWRDSSPNQKPQTHPRKAA
jgi:CRP-like cAMP-binding protein